MAKAENKVTVEIAGPNCESVYWQPLRRKIRGRFDFHKPRGANARAMLDEFPQPIPGQMIEVDLSTGETAIVEPLRLTEHKVTAERLKKKLNCEFAPVREEVGKLDLPTAIFWLNRIVNDGLAVVIKGDLPSDPGGKPQMSFLNPPRESPTDKLTAAIEAQTKAIMSLLRHVAKQQTTGG